MVIHFHTRNHVYTVEDGICKAVINRQKEPAFPHLDKCPLVSGVEPNLANSCPPDQIKVGMCLQFKIGESTVTTDVVTRIEEVPRASILPSPLASLPPPSIHDGDVFATWPERPRVPRPAKPSG